MLSAIKELGSLVLQDSGKSELSTLIETIDRERYPNMICLIFQDEEPYDFIDIVLEETNAVRNEKYLYRKGSSRGANFSPTALVTEVDKTLLIKIWGWFSALEKNKQIEDIEKDFFAKIRKSLDERKDIILKKTKEFINNPKDGWVLTIKLGEKYLLDIPQFKDVFQKLIIDKEEEISASDCTCSVCGEKKDKVYGGASPFRFYTIDKPGYISGGFDKQFSWRNFPVCWECYLALIEGKRLLREELTFRFYGLSYQLIPNLIFGKESWYGVADILLNQAHKKILLNQKTEDNLFTYEEDLLRHLAEVEDNVTFQLLFLRTQNSAERILLIIEDILPSRLRELFRAKRAADILFPQSPFHIGKFRSFLGKSDPENKNTDLDKYFLEIVDSMFQGKQVHLNFLLTHYMREIRRDFVNEEQSYFFKGNDAIQGIYFLSELGLLERKEDKMVETIFDLVFTKYIQQLDTNEKRGIFLLGCLTKMLLNIQWRERKSQPFIAQLKGLKMNEMDIKGLLPKVEGKLSEYKRLDKQKAVLAKTISDLLLSSPKRWELTIDEINFYFVCGMNLYQEINIILYGEKEEDADVVD